MTNLENGNHAGIDWIKFIIQSFFIAGDERSDLDLSGYVFLFERCFDLVRVQDQLNTALAQANDPDKSRRYHKTEIRKLAIGFTNALLHTIKDGSCITVADISAAKILIETENACIYQC